MAAVTTSTRRAVEPITPPVYRSLITAGKIPASPDGTGILQEVMSRPMMRPRLALRPVASRVMCLALWIGALVFAVSAVRYTMDARLIVPFADEWDFLAWHRDA